MKKRSNKKSPCKICNHLGTHWCDLLKCPVDHDYPVEPRFYYEGCRPSVIRE